jgi:hypothetical protein
MRFGSHTHVDPDQLDPKLKTERDRLVTTLRGLADRIEAAPLERLSEGLASMLVAVEPLVRAVQRALGR